MVMGQLRTLIILMLIEGKCLSQTAKKIFVHLMAGFQFNSKNLRVSSDLYCSVRIYVMYRTIYPQIKWTGLDVVSDQVL